MNYTKNHHLPQWVKSDRIRMEDFNQMNQSIESGLNGADTKASAAQASAASAAADAANALAKATAAGTAIENAYTPDNKPYTVGSYVGDPNNQTIRLPFRPSFLIIAGMQTGSDPNSHSTFDQYFAIYSGDGSLENRLLFVSDGFIVYRAAFEGAYQPVLNEPGRRYCFIAFR